MIHTTTFDNGFTIIRPGAARLTAANAKTFKDEVTDIINGGANRVVIDFKNVSFLDSSGLGALVGVLKKVGHRGELVVSGLNSDVQQMFRICRMDRVFTVYKDVETATQSMAEFQ
ncbi:STAS domain-containing protein [Yoonia vestfoldensis]|uniref:STAS domain-containing protein n=1 Tax=Yoonia vestfoldensis TaxID=245188 RepID=UPI0003775130|nr:STAS domain-containing protein [Yoonia vestfoldensis]